MRKLAIAIAVLFIAACGGTDYPTEPTHSTVTITKEAEPVTPEPVTVTVEPTEADDEIDVFLNSEEAHRTVVELAWTSTTGEDQENICYAWKNIPGSKDILLDTFFDGFGDEYAPSRQFMRDFFDEKCL